MADYKQLCAELVESVRYLSSCLRNPDDGFDPVALSECEAHFHHALTQLAQPEPEGLTDEELEDVARTAEVRSTREQGGLNANDANGIAAQLQVQRLAGLRAVFAAGKARRPTPQPPADSELTVNLRMDLSSECLKRLCDGLAAAVKPNGGYRALTTDDDISGEFIGEQQVGVEWWLPEHGSDSLENTLDSIKGRLLAAVRDWLPTAMTPAPQPPADGEVEELVAWLNQEAAEQHPGYSDALPDGVRDCLLNAYARLTRAAELLQRQHPQPPADGEVAVSDDLRHLVRFMCQTWVEIDQWARKFGADALDTFPMIQGTRNQMNLRQIAAQRCDSARVAIGVQLMLSPEVIVQSPPLPTSEEATNSENVDRPLP